MSAYLDIASWQPLGRHQYRQVRLYESMRWSMDNIDLNDYIIAASPYGGCIALVRDSSKMTAFRSGKEKISIYTAAGKLLSEVLVADEGRLAHMGWFNQELLVIVYSNGVVDIFDSYGHRQDNCFNLLPSLSDETIMNVAIEDNCMAALSSSPDGIYGLHLVDNLKTNPSPLIAQDLGLNPGIRPTCMTVIDGKYTEHGRMEVYLGTPSRSIVVVSSDQDATDQDVSSLLSSVPLMFAVSPRKRFLAVLGEDGVLIAVETNFERKILEFETEAVTPPDQLVWCGEDSIVLVWKEKGILIVGPLGDTLKLSFDEGVYAIEEIDALRIITQDHHELLQRVPDALVKIRSIGSTEPCAILADASHMFNEGDAKCDDSIRNLIMEDTLYEAINECIIAATHEWDPSNQQTLLRAASYGKNFFPTFPKDIFTDSCRKLRILNEIRNSTVGIPLTIEQYDKATPQILVNRLITRHEHRLALHICDFLSLPRQKDTVLVHWACAKVRASARQGIADETVRDLLRERLAGVASVSYADIAAAADQAGRRRLATMLLDFEPRAADQVPILLRMREGRLALEKAIDSGDTDLIYLVLNQMRRALRSGLEIGINNTNMVNSSSSNMNDSSTGNSDTGSNNGLIGTLDLDDEDASFIKVILNYPIAVDLLTVWASNQDTELLLTLQIACGRFIDAGKRLVLQANKEEELKDRISGLKRACELFKEGEKHPRLSTSVRSQCGIFARATEEQIALLIAQAQLENDLDDKGALSSVLGDNDTMSVDSSATLVSRSQDKDLHVTDLSLADTIFRLLLVGETVWTKRAEKFAKDFKLSESQFYYIRIKALASKRDWGNLWTLANERKSPVGYKPFAEACISGGSNMEAKRYIMTKMTDKEYTDRMDLLMMMGGTGVMDMIELASKQKDGDRLQDLQKLAITPSTQAALEKALTDLGYTS